jgi:hypothetical protein
MRRALAITLLLALMAPLAPPLFAAAARDPEASLPACCRRHGMHHCAMMAAMLRALNRPAFTAPPCSSYPSPATPPQLATASLSASLPLVLFHLVAPAPPAPAPRSAHPSFIASSNLKRGPPAFLA